jgi:hypothetical protein
MGVKGDSIDQGEGEVDALFARPNTQPLPSMFERGYSR